MKKIGQIVFWLLISISCIAQSMDSIQRIKNVLVVPNGNPAYGFQMIDISEQYFFAQDVDSCFFYLNLAQEYVQKFPDDSLEIEVLVTFSNVLANYKENQKSLEYLAKCFIHPALSKYPILDYSVNQRIANNLREVELYDSSKYHIQLSLEKIDTTLFPFALARANLDYGVIESAKGNERIAIEYYLIADSYLDKNLHSNITYNLRYNLAASFYEIENYPKAIQYFKESLSYIENHPFMQSIILNALGHCYTEIGNFEIAESYLKKSIINNKMVDKVTLGYSQAGLADINFRRKKSNYALSLAEQSYASFYELEDIDGMIEIAALVSEEMIKLKRFEVAKKWLQLEKKYLKKKKNIDRRILSRLQFKELSYEVASQLDSTFYNYLISYKNEKDSLTKEKLAHQIEELDFIYQTSAKQDSIALLKSKEIVLASTIKNQRLTLILTVLSLLFAGVFMYQTWRQNQLKTKANNLLSAQNEKIKILLWEVQHRVKNNLLFISSLLDMQANSSLDSAAQQALMAARDRIETMSLLHQRLLYKEEILASVNIENYLTELLDELKMVYKGDHTKHFRINLQVDEAFLDLDQALPLGLIVNELVTNAMKHANIPVNESLEIKVFYEHNKQRKLIVQDNGQSEKLIANSSENSFGMQLVKLLVRQLKGSFSISNNAGLRYEIIF